MKNEHGCCVAEPKKNVVDIKEKCGSESGGHVLTK